MEGQRGRLEGVGFERKAKLIVTGTAFATCATLYASEEYHSEAMRLPRIDATEIRASAVAGGCGAVICVAAIRHCVRAIARSFAFSHCQFGWRDGVIFNIRHSAQRTPDAIEVNYFDSTLVAYRAIERPYC